MGSRLRGNDNLDFLAFIGPLISAHGGEIEMTYKIKLN